MIVAQKYFKCQSLIKSLSLCQNVMQMQKLAIHVPL